MKTKDTEKMKQIALENGNKPFTNWDNTETKQHPPIDRKTQIKTDLRQIYKRYDGSHYIKLLDAIEEYILTKC